MDDDDEMVARSCTALFLTSLADGVRTLFKHDTNTLRQHPNESTTKESQKSPSPKKKTRSVKFQYPVITSTHHRPMTEDDDIENLFFTEEEMDELEDDRYNTQFADHVEVLAEGQSWDTPVFQLSTSSNLSIEEDEELFHKDANPDLTYYAASALVLIGRSPPICSPSWH